MESLGKFLKINVEVNGFKMKFSSGIFMSFCVILNPCNSTEQVSKIMVSFPAYIVLIIFD